MSNDQVGMKADERETSSSGPLLPAQTKPKTRAFVQVFERDAGVREYRECRRNPALRHVSWLAGAGRRSWLGLWIVGLTVRHAGVSGKVLRFACRIPGLRASARAAAQALDRLA